MQSTDQISQIQLDSLDDTDCYASIWEQILSQDRKQSSNTNLWGGRGKGGRGLARRTIQPKDIVVEDVSLQYLGRSDAFLEGATIKLLHNHVYALIGRNGCGKSTLIKRMYSQKVPGWSSQWSSLYIPPDLSPEFFNLSPLQVIEKYHEDFKNNTNTATEARIVDLEEEMDKLDPENEQEAIEKLCAEMSILEDAMSSGVNLLMHKDKDVRDFLQNLQIDADTPCGNLEPAQQKEVLLLVASLLGDMVNLVLLDEPARNLSVRGLLRLRQLIESSSSTILMVSHDIDLINDVSTDIIDMHAQKLHYYPGNYDSYRLMKEQRSHHLLQQSVEMEKKQDKLKSTLQHLKEQPTSRRKGGATKKAKAIASHRRKMEWHKESIKKLDASSEILPERKGLTPAQRLKLAETIKTTPDKAVQFAFPKTASQWGEPLIVAYDIGYGFDKDALQRQEGPAVEESTFVDDDGILRFIKRDGFLFDCVNLCIEEGSINCLLGPDNYSSCLLQILAKRLVPVEGTVYQPPGVRVGYCSYHVVREIVFHTESSTTALVHLLKSYPKKNEKEIRGHLSQFGLSPTSQEKTPLCFLSGGEAFRFALAALMLEDPPVICIENPTASLDVESVQALAFGLQNWNGTVVMTSVDAFFLRALENLRCFVISESDGKLRRLPPEMQGIDGYLKKVHLDD